MKQKPSRFEEKKSQNDLFVGLFSLSSAHVINFFLATDIART
jgi:hypothetical protein